MNLFSSTKTMSKRAFAAILAAAMAFVLAVAAVGTVLSTQAQAASPEYKYTVRVFSGSQGSFNGKDCLVLTTSAKPGDRVSFNQGSVSLNNGSKYYIRGVRQSGRDNDTTLATPSFTVTGDIDLVVSYGVLGDNVAYTVRYVDTDGNELSPTETFYGNVGESPVIAYRYIDGYVPQAYNLTGKLLSDASKNVYTFTYSAIEGAAEPAPTPTPEQPTPNPPVVTEVPGAGGDAPAAGAVEDGATIPDDANPLANPEETKDIRDDGNPLSSFVNNFLGDDASILSNHSTIAILGGLLAAAILAIAIVLIVRNRRKKQQLAYGTAGPDGSGDNGAAA